MFSQHFTRTLIVLASTLALCVVAAEETTLDPQIQEYLDDIDQLADFLEHHPDITDKARDTLHDNGPVYRIVTANERYLKNDSKGDEDDTGVPKHLCFYSVCVKKCENNTLCWAARRCHIDRQCANVKCASSCRNEVLTSVKTVYTTVIDIPKELRLIREIEETLFRRKNNTRNP